jgi:hypothetical protein
MSNKKPFCKVCRDSGKSEKEYSSHWVKDLNGKTTCPVLLNTECRYCFKLGHTAKFCDALLKNNKEKERRNNTYYQEPPKKKPEEKKPANKYAALDEDSDLEEEYPVLVNSSQVSEIPEVKTNCWAEIAAKPKVQLEEKPVIKIPTIKLDTKPIVRKSWADWSDSEDEEDETW